MSNRLRDHSVAALARRRVVWLLDCAVDACEENLCFGCGGRCYYELLIRLFRVEDLIAHILIT